jgi:hypothetical protein
MEKVTLLLKGQDFVAGQGDILPFLVCSVATN